MEKSSVAWITAKGGISAWVLSLSLSFIVVVIMIVTVIVIMIVNLFVIEIAIVVALTCLQEELLEVVFRQHPLLHQLSDQVPLGDRRQRDRALTSRELLKDITTG